MFCYRKNMASVFHSAILKWVFVLFLAKVFSIGMSAGKHNFSVVSFVFGDSLVDTGNNNYLGFTLSKANYAPNGMDFPTTQPSGRYTNGRTIPDIISQALGEKLLPPPYLAPSTKGSVLVEAGVNYASGGGGILPDTGKIFIERLSMDAQLNNFIKTRQDIISMLGQEGAQNFFNSAVFSVTIGANDFINNYFLRIQRNENPQSFIEILLGRFRNQLYELYSMGARKIIVVNVGPVGCIPYQRATNSDLGPDGCVDYRNQVVQAYNSGLRNIVVSLNSCSPGATFVYANIYDVVMDIIRNYTTYGFESAGDACCGAGRYRGIIPCGPAAEVCGDHSKYVFWDPYHPTESANIIIAKRLLDGGPNVCFPMNIRALSKI